jgi:hypothetical protein
VGDDAGGGAGANDHEIELVLKTVGHHKNTEGLVVVRQPAQQDK